MNHWLVVLTSPVCEDGFLGGHCLCPECQINGGFNGRSFLYSIFQGKVNFDHTLYFYLKYLLNFILIWLFIFCFFPLPKDPPEQGGGCTAYLGCQHCPSMWTETKSFRKSPKLFYLKTDRKDTQSPLKDSQDGSLGVLSLVMRMPAFKLLLLPHSTVSQSTSMVLLKNVSSCWNLQSCIVDLNTYFLQTYTLVHASRSDVADENAILSSVFGSDSEAPSSLQGYCLEVAWSGALIATLLKKEEITHLVQ